MKYIKHMFALPHFYQAASSRIKRTIRSPLRRYEAHRETWGIRNNNNNNDPYAESGQNLQGSFSAVSKPNFASKYSLESSRRDLRNTLLCTVLESESKSRGKENAPGPKRTLEKMKSRSAGATTRYLVLQRK